MCLCNAGPSHTPRPAVPGPPTLCRFQTCTCTVRWPRARRGDASCASSRPAASSSRPRTRTSFISVPATSRSAGTARPLSTRRPRRPRRRRSRRRSGNGSCRRRWSASRGSTKRRRARRTRRTRIRTRIRTRKTRRTAKTTRARTRKRTQPATTRARKSPQMSPRSSPVSLRCKSSSTSNASRRSGRLKLPDATRSGWQTPTFFPRFQRRHRRHSSREHLSRTQLDSNLASPNRWAIAALVKDTLQSDEWKLDAALEGSTDRSSLLAGLDRQDAQKKYRLGRATERCYGWHIHLVYTAKLGEYDLLVQL